MAPNLRGLNVTQALITRPIQWHLLLLMVDQPLTLGRASRAFSWRQWGRCWLGLGWLWRHQLIVFHVKRGGWTLTAAGETLRPILAAIQVCSTSR